MANKKWEYQIHPAKLIIVKWNICGFCEVRSGSLLRSFTAVHFKTKIRSHSRKLPNIITRHGDNYQVGHFITGSGEHYPVIRSHLSHKLGSGVMIIFVRMWNALLLTVSSHCVPAPDSRHSLSEKMMKDPAAVTAWRNQTSPQIFVLSSELVWQGPVQLNGD